MTIGQIVDIIRHNPGFSAIQLRSKGIDARDAMILKNAEAAGFIEYRTAGWWPVTSEGWIAEYTGKDPGILRDGKLENARVLGKVFVADQRDVSPFVFFPDGCPHYFPVFPGEFTILTARVVSKEEVQNGTL